MVFAVTPDAGGTTGSRAARSRSAAPGRASTTPPSVWRARAAHTQRRFRFFFHPRIVPRPRISRLLISAAANLPPEVQSGVASSPAPAITGMFRLAGMPEQAIGGG